MSELKSTEQAGQETRATAALLVATPAPAAPQPPPGFARFLRWGAPIAFSLIAVFLFLPGHRHGVALFGISALLSLTTWWIAISERRWLDAWSRLKKLSLVLPVLLLAVVAGLSDLWLDLALPRNVLIVVFAVLWLLSLVLLRRNARRMLMQVLLLLVMTALSLGIGELIVRYGVAEWTAPMSERSLKKRVIASWPRAVQQAKKPGVFRILCLGDSFGQMGGYGNYHYLLQEICDREKLPVEIVNLSVSGYQVDWERDILRKYGKRYKPDLVLHNFFAGNDFEVPPVNFVYLFDLPILLNKGIGSWRPHNWLLRNAVEHLYALNLERLRKAKETGGAPQPDATFSDETYLGIERTRLEVCSRQAPLLGAAPRVREILEQTQKEAEKLGARYVIVMHPDAVQVDAQLRAKVQEKHPFNPADFDLGAPQRFVGECARALGVPFEDIYAEKGANEMRGASYLPRDTHYNPEGNQKAARAIFEFLQASGMLPAPAK